MAGGQRGTGAGASLPLLSRHRRRLTPSVLGAGNERWVEEAAAGWAHTAAPSPSWQCGSVTYWRRLGLFFFFPANVRLGWASSFYFFSAHAPVGWVFSFGGQGFYVFSSNVPMGLITSSTFLLDQPKIV